MKVLFRAPGPIPLLPHPFKVPHDAGRISNVSGVSVRLSKQASMTRAARQTMQMPPPASGLEAVVRKRSTFPSPALEWGLAWQTMNDDSITIGVRLGRVGNQPFGLSRADRRQHLYIIGQTGVGKTTLLKNLILQDIADGRGVGVIDPHGDLAEELLNYIPPQRADDLVYFNPADLDRPIAFNLLEPVPPDERPMVASSIVSVFKSVWRDSWGPRTEYILYNAAAALLDCQNVSLLGVQRMLVDETYRAWVVKQVRDPAIRSFWVNEFGRYDSRFMQEAIAPIQNKVGQLLASPMMRNILGQVRSKMDMRFMMDGQRIFVANLSKGALGEDKSNLLGAILVSKFELAAMSRTNIPEEERKDFYLYVDEFQNFASDAFISILSEARKYRLALTLSHQYLDQLRSEIRSAVLGNAGTIIAFRISPRDAEALVGDLGFAPSHLARLNNRLICVKLLEKGEYGETFMGVTLAPSAKRYGNREKLRELSQQKYGKPRASVEEKILRWWGQQESE